ncbi:MAG: hypothetical protein VZR24_06030, partial [Butyrivibrio hungatei]|nr:hypothetical protein [Butyrivibrio hungatei]
EDQCEMSFVRMIQEWLSACFKNACPDNKRLRVRIIQESCPDVTRIITYKMTEIHRKETSESLPRALLKLRDSMVTVDDALSKSLVVESSGGSKR